MISRGGRVPWTEDFRFQVSDSFHVASICRYVKSMPLDLYHQGKCCDCVLWLAWFVTEQEIKGDDEIIQMPISLKERGGSSEECKRYKMNQVEE